jgi:hypothetical protein
MREVEVDPSFCQAEPRGASLPDLRLDPRPGSEPHRDPGRDPDREGGVPALDAMALGGDVRGPIREHDDGRRGGPRAASAQAELHHHDPRDHRGRERGAAATAEERRERRAGPMRPPVEPRPQPSLGAGPVALGEVRDLRLAHQPPDRADPLARGLALRATLEVRGEALDLGRGELAGLEGVEHGELGVRPGRRGAPGGSPAVARPFACAPLLHGRFVPAGAAPIHRACSDPHFVASSAHPPGASFRWMSGGAPRLTEGWDRAIPEAGWPAALVAAVRQDPGALATPRVIDTLRAWRDALHGAPAERAEASRHLAGVAAALTEPAARDVPLMAPAPDDLALPARPRLRRPPPAPTPAEDEDTDAKVPTGAAGAVRRAASETARPLGLAEPGIDGGEETPTRALDFLPELRRRSATGAPPPLPVPDAGELVELEATDFASPPGSSARPPATGARRAASAARPVGADAAEPPTAGRPRASLQHVRTLHAALDRFAEELVPLPFERRSRRFWARWREVAGDRGVRREFVEHLLRRATDTRTLVAELIAEMQTVDLASVYALVDLVSAERGSPPAPREQRDGGPSVARTRGEGR